MNLQDLISRVFPEGRVHLRRFGFDVDGLVSGTVPRNCEILLHGVQPHERGERRDHYLVRTMEGALMLFRICTALDGSGYDEFVAGRPVALFDWQKTDLERRARVLINALCAPVPA